MLDKDKIDFKKIGFRAGLEIHHQIVAQRKLFCNCKPILFDGEPDYVFERYFRPVLGEMGDFDPGMLIEFEKGYRVIYHAYEGSVCIYEQDEQPPFWPDYDAIYRGFELAHWLNCTSLVDEVVVSRKQYLDGSITTGFQRTMIVARNGWIPVNGKKIRISNLTVEEDAARKIKTENFGRTVYYNLDRLGIPLVEVITDHRDCDNPKDLRLLAEYIGLTLRLSGIGCRGIGTVRQDVNLSIEGGNRVELKGIQDLAMFEEMARREVVRQDMLLQIAKKLKERELKAEELEHTYIDLHDIFSHIEMPENYVILGIRLPKFGGILGIEVQPGKDFGQDIIEKAELISGIPRNFIFHSDEMKEISLRKLALKNEMAQEKNTSIENFFFKKITSEIDKQIRKILLLNKNDAYALAIGPQKWVIHCMKKIIERTKMALNGVPQETRKLLPNGNSEFLRVIHGKDRLYPDTDTPPIDMDIEKINTLKEKVKKRPWELEKEFKEKYGFNYEQVKNLIRHENINTIIALTEEQQFEPKLCYYLLEEIIVALRRENYDVKKLSLEKIIEILNGVKNNIFDRNQIPIITRKVLEFPEKNFEKILSDLNIKSISESKLEEIYSFSMNEMQKRYDITKIDANFLKNKVIAFIIQKVNYSISGKRINEFVKSRMKKTKKEL